MAERLRHLLSKFNIPLNIPSELSELAVVATDKDWDGPQAIAEMRNGVVHPNLRERSKNDKLVDEINRLSKWYAELAILRSLDYKGEYHNSIKSSLDMDQEPVPWIS